jgi:hypothetical protein
MRCLKPAEVRCLLLLAEGVGRQRFYNLVRNLRSAEHASWWHLATKDSTGDKGDGRAGARLSRRVRDGDVARPT